MHKARTTFQRNGITGATLNDKDRDLLAGQGLDPNALDYSGTELEVAVTNCDTLRRQWEEIMEVCIKDRAGNLPGKTIVFAMTKNYAEHVRDMFVAGDTPETRGSGHPGCRRGTQRGCAGRGRTASAHHAAGKRNQPAHTPVMGEQGASYG